MLVQVGWTSRSRIEFGPASKPVAIDRYEVAKSRPQSPVEIKPSLLRFPKKCRPVPDLTKSDRFPSLLRDTSKFPLVRV